MRSGYWIRHPDGRLEQTDDIVAFARFMESPERRIGLDTVGEYEVSTVFLGIDHNYAQDGPPILFETMIFKNKDMAGEFQYRYSTEEEARAGHKLAVDKLVSLYANALEMGACAMERHR